MHCRGVQAAVKVFKAAVKVLRGRCQGVKAAVEVLRLLLRY
jgi:hypothetical protein